MNQKQETRIVFAILGIIFAAFAGYIWGTMLVTQPFFGFANGGAIIGVLIGLAILALGEALRKP